VRPETATLNVLLSELGLVTVIVAAPRPPAEPLRETSLSVKPETSSLKVAVKLIGWLLVGSACVPACSTVTSGFVVS
jgi:hypothetical protein